MPYCQKQQRGHMGQGFIAQELQALEHMPGNPGVCVDVERSDGSSKEWRGFKHPHFHIGTGVPLVRTIYYTIIAEPR